MSLLATTADAVEVAFDAAGDLVLNPTWRKVTDGGYNPQTGQLTTNNTDNMVRAIMGEFDAATLAKADLSERAIRIYVPAVDFTKVNILPVKGDKLILDQVIYTVQRAVWEGSPVLWEVWADI